MRATDPRFRILLKETYVTPNIELASDTRVSNSIKTFVKRWPLFYHFLEKTVGPSHSILNRYNLKDTLRKLYGGTLGDNVVLNLGSGTYRIHPEIINVDLFAFKEVDVVADVCAMPFKDNSVDGIVCEYVLEHIADTATLFKEMTRILKPGGTLILTAPFICPYHSSPDDFFRWTEDGLKYLFKEYGYTINRSGMHGGPMGALQGVLMHVFAILFSFGSKTVYFFLVQFFMVLLSPLKLLDLFFMLPNFSIDIASAIFVVATKNK